MTKTDKKSHALTAFIALALLACVVTAGLFVARERSSRSEQIDTPAPLPPPPEDKDGLDSWEQERWQGIYQARRKIGWSMSRIRRTRDGFHVWSQSRIKVTLMDQAQEINLDLRGALDQDYAVKQFEFLATMAPNEIKAKGKRVGKVIKLELETVGETIEHELVFDEPPTLDMAWKLAERMKTAKLGDRYSLELFEPFSSQNVEVSVVVAGEEEIELDGQSYPCWKAEVKLMNQTSWMWFRKSDAEVLKEYMPATGMTVLLESREKALDVDWDQAAELDLIGTLMVPSSRPIKGSRDTTYFNARLVGAPLEGLDLGFPPRQIISGATVEIQVQAAMPGQGYLLPISSSLPGKASEMADLLKPTPYIQSDHKKILEAAAEALDGATDASLGLENIMDWMGREIEPVMVASVPSALETLKRRRGACKEHTVLFVALCRAAGIPARPVAGVVYTDRLVTPGFYYHAWAEVYLTDPSGEGGWIAVDPTFRQMPADATHIRMVVGGLDQMVRLSSVMGLLKVEVVEVRR